MVNARGRHRAFTLLELLIVIAIIVIVTAVTLMAYRGVATDVRMSAAVQNVGAVLEEARAQAIRDGRPTLVAFRSRKSGEGTHFVEAVVGQASGESFLYSRQNGSSLASDYFPATRFVPIGGVEPREMPDSVGFAVPALQFGDDEMFLMTSRVDESGLAAGIVPAVMFGPDGEPVNYEQGSDAALIFVDFDGDGGQRIQDAKYCNHFNYEVGFGQPPACPPDRRDGFEEGFVPPGECYVLNLRNPDTGLIDADDVVFDEFLPLCQFEGEDEPFVVLSTELTMFDETAAREQFIATNWTRDEAGAARRGKELNDFIAANGLRIRLNRYTGVTQREN